MRPLAVRRPREELTVQVLSLRRIQPPGPRLGLVRLRAGGEGAPVPPLRQGGCRTRLSVAGSDLRKLWGVTSRLRGRRSGGLGVDGPDLAMVVAVAVACLFSTTASLDRPELEWEDPD